MIPKPNYKHRPKHLRIPLKVKLQVYERDHGICQGCGRKGTELHHIIFRSHGGKHEVDNLVLLCRWCHELAHMYREHRLKWEKWRLRE